MKLFLKSLNVSRFKGIEAFKLMFDATETRIYGANATGKTTLADAFFFVFTGKDSQERQAKDWIQTLDADNNKIHKLDHEAELVVELNGDTIVLGRKVKEKWTKPKGQKDEVLADTLDYTYYIDGVPTPAKKFEQFIKDKFMADIIHLLSNPMAFCSMDWKKQREMLYQVCGEASDEDVISTDVRFAFLEDALKHKDIETLKAALRKTILTLKDEIKELDAVIKDRKANLIQEYVREEVLKEKEVKENRIKELNKQLEAGEEIFNQIKEKQKLVLEIEEARDKAKKAHNDEVYKERNEARGQLFISQGNFNKFTSKKESLLASIERSKKEIGIANEQIAGAKKEWIAKNKQVLEEDSKVCPCCGQDMPEDKLIEIYNRFDKDKAIVLERIVNKANQFKAFRAKEEAKISENEKIIQDIDLEIEKLKVSIEVSQNLLNKEVDETSLDTSEFDNRIVAIQSEIESFKVVDNSQIKEKLESEHKNLQITMIKLHKCDQYDKAIGEVKAKEKEKLDKQVSLAETETQLINATDFVTTKVKMLEDKVNSKFETVKFKLFKLNQKGNYEETCTALVDGVDWMIANTAAKVQAGIEVINALQKHFNFYTPVWVDNRESVTELPSINSQLINLIVSENDATLRVE